MTRKDIIRELVLTSICDDYENVDQFILPHLAQGLAEVGAKIDRSEIVAALKTLIADGMATAHLLSPHPPYDTRLKAMPTLEVPETDFETYFLVTEKGLEHQADEALPTLGQLSEADIQVLRGEIA